MSLSLTHILNSWKTQQETYVTTWLISASFSLTNHFLQFIPLWSSCISHDSKIWLRAKSLSVVAADHCISTEPENRGCCPEGKHI